MITVGMGTTIVSPSVIVSPTVGFAPWRASTVVLISSDLQEILGMSDRILVMRAGRIAARFDRGEATEEGIIAAALATSAESEAT